MGKKLIYYIKEIFLIIIVMSIASNLLSIYKSQNLNKEPLKIGKIKLLNNTTYIFKNNKPLLVHFWATWCPICKLEADNIQRVSKHYNVVTVAVKSGPNKAINKFLSDNNLNFKVTNDKKSIYANQFNISGFPTTFIYDKHQKLIFTEVGYTSTIGLFIRMWWASL